MIYTSTGNGIEFVSEFANSEEILIGLHIQLSNTTIPLPNPEAFLAVAQSFADTYKKLKKKKKK
jgi:hypothetical protein